MTEHPYREKFGSFIISCWKSEEDRRPFLTIEDLNGLSYMEELSLEDVKRLNSLLSGFIERND